MRVKIIVLFLFASGIFNSGILFPEEDLIAPENRDTIREIQEEIRWLQAEAVVPFAIEHDTQIRYALSTTTIITNEEIKQLGSRVLTDVLEALPEFDFSLCNRDCMKHHIKKIAAISRHHKFK